MTIGSLKKSEKILGLLVFVSLAAFVFLFIYRNNFEKDQMILDSQNHVSIKDADLEYSDDIQKSTCELREKYCGDVGYGFADNNCDCYTYQFKNLSTVQTGGVEDSFTLYYPDLWQVNSTPIGLDEVMIDEELSLSRSGGYCDIIYGKVDIHKDISGYDSLRKGRYVFGEPPSIAWSPEVTEELDVITLFVDEPNDLEKSAGYTNKKVIVVPHFPYESSEFGFVLLSRQEPALVEACESEFTTILDGRAIQYPAYELNKNSRGTFSLFSSLSWINLQNSDSETMMVYENEFTGKKRLIHPDVFTEIGQYSSPMLSGDKIYYLFKKGQTQKSTIRSVDIFSGERDTITVDYDNGDYIHSYYVRNGSLYYLQGEYCDRYRDVCADMDLIHHDLVTGATQTLSAISQSRDIAGYSAKMNALVLHRSDGDAGCLWGTYEFYDLARGVLGDPVEYSECTDDQRTHMEYLDIVDGTVSATTFMLRDGNIFIPKDKSFASDKTSNFPFSRKIHIRANVSEYHLIDVVPEPGSYSLELPEYIGTNYEKNWPPAITSSSQQYSCVPSTGQNRVVSETVIGDRVYCKDTLSSGYTGGVGVERTYTTLAPGGDMYTANFTLLYPNCSTYGTAGHTKYDQCKVNQSIFNSNLDEFVNSLIQEKMNSKN